MREQTKSAKRLPESLGARAVTSLTRRGYGIEKDSVGAETIAGIKSFLTVSPQANPMAGGNAPPKSYPVFRESRSKLYIPKYLGLSAYGPPAQDKTSPGEPLSCSFGGSLRESQAAPVAAFLQAAADPRKRGGIINMGCAAGKTVMGIYAACQLGRKTLVIVNKEFLARQWQERIEEFAPGARVGKVQGTAFDVDDRDFVIAMVQTLSVREFEQDAFDSFGTVIVDECHHMSAEVFCRALHRINFRNALGLSATLQRSDGLSHVFQWFIGGVVYKTKRPKEAVEVLLKDVCSDDPDYKQELYVFGKQLNMARMISNVCALKARTEFVAGSVLGSLADRPGSKVLVLSERRAHLADIKDAISLADPGVTVGFYVGGMKQEDLKASESKQVILGTFTMAAEGMDIPALDTLVLASPKSAIEQPVGRILRVRAGDRQRVPRVVDIRDMFSVFRAQAAKRERYYAKCGYKT